MEYTEKKVPHGNKFCIHRTYEDGRVEISTGSLNKDDPDYIEPGSFKELRLLVFMLLRLLFHRIKDFFQGTFRGLND